MTLAAGTMADRHIEVVEHVLTLLDEGSFTSTYKCAVLMGMLELCRELTNARGEPPESITTRQLAERVVEIYWAHVRPHQDVAGGTTWPFQNSNARRGRRAKILELVQTARAQLEHATGRSVAFPEARRLADDKLEQLFCDVEWKLIEMPLPKLQRLGAHDTRWLYQISFDDGEHKARKKQVSAYQRGTADADFDNLIRFRPGVAETFHRLHDLLRPFVERRWVQIVSRFNGFETDHLHAWLFGSERESLNRVRAPLLELQRGTCFYCGGPLRSGVEVDHFIPWARHAENALENLVAAHGPCNNRKRDYLAATHHVARWSERNTREASTLEQIANDVSWDRRPQRVLGVARALYLSLPEDARLWSERSVFVAPDMAQLRAALGVPA